MTKIDKLEIKIIKFGELLIFPITFIVLVSCLPLLILYYVYKWYIKPDQYLMVIHEYKQGVTETID